MCCCVADKVFFSIALYMGDGGYQVVRMLIISVRHFTGCPPRAPQQRWYVYKDTSENSDALGLGIKLQVRILTGSMASCLMVLTSRLCTKLPGMLAAGLTYSPVSHHSQSHGSSGSSKPEQLHRLLSEMILPCRLGDLIYVVRLMVMSLLKAPCRAPARHLLDLSPMLLTGRRRRRSGRCARACLFRVRSAGTSASSASSSSSSSAAIAIPKIFPPVKVRVAC